MKEKKGFTLIELLAVILILGIIALIAIPVVNNIIKVSKKGAFEATAMNIVDAVENACQLQVLKDEAITPTYTFTDGVVSPTLDIKGKLPSSGTVTVDSNCNSVLNVTNGTFTATKENSSDTITIVEGDTVTDPTYTVYTNGTAVYFNPETGAKCTVGEAVSTTGTKTGCMKWYTFADGGSTTSTINLILDHNTTAAVVWNSVRDNTTGPNQILTQIQTDTSSWAGVSNRTDSYIVNNGTANYTTNYSTYKARLITAGEIATIIGNTTFNETTTNHNDWFYLDSKNQTKVATSIGASNYEWLFDYTNNCTTSGCNIAAAGVSGYWTATPVPGFSGIAWYMASDSSMSGSYVDTAGSYGLRPVITILKSNI